MKISWKINWKVLIMLTVLCGALVFGLYVSQLRSLPQAAYYLFPQTQPITQKDRVLIISPHQDDETIGVGGFIQQVVAAHAAIEIVFATDGNKHGLKNIRHQEAVAADTKLGIGSGQQIFWDFPDGRLDEQAEFYQKLSDEIDTFLPTRVITTLPDDAHPDHAACGQAVSKKWLEKNKSFQVYYFLVHFQRYPRPIGEKIKSYLLPPVQLVNEKYLWQSVPLTESQEATKEQAIEQYRSQKSLRNPILAQLLKSFIRRNEMLATPRI